MHVDATERAAAREAPVVEHAGREEGAARVGWVRRDGCVREGAGVLLHLRRRVARVEHEDARVRGGRAPREARVAAHDAVGEQ